MQRPLRVVGILVLVCVCLAGCTSRRAGQVLERASGSAALVGQFKAYDGKSGEPIEWADVMSRASRADVVLFGEEHSNAVCNGLEARLLATLAKRPRPAALAMEFFETDTQPTVNDYLAGRMDESEFREKSRQNRAYLLAHRPLIELCRGAGMPVIAANAPRRLVRGLRTSGLPYDEYLATLSPTDQALLPAKSTAERDTYWERFIEIMRDHASAATQPTTAPATQPSEVAVAVAEPVGNAPASQPDDSPSEELYQGFRAQCLWDDSMADAVARHRDSNSARVMLIIGSFHVAHGGGTAAKFRAGRPGDGVCTIILRAATDTRMAFDPKDRSAGDVVIYGVTPPEKKG